MLKDTIQNFQWVALRDENGPKNFMESYIPQP